MVKVAITGALDGCSRKEAAQMIEGVGAEFVPSVTYETDYLVAVKLDTAKARKAQSIGVRIITQGEFEELIAQGAFPERSDSNKPKGSLFNSPPKFDWQPLNPEQQQRHKIEYFDADGVITSYEVTPLAIAQYTTVRGSKNTYIKAIDHTDQGAAKTFRADRFIGKAPFLPEK